MISKERLRMLSACSVHSDDVHSAESASVCELNVGVLINILRPSKYCC